MNDGNSVFVFGSNEAGNHAGGAARTAAIEWGAIQGVGFGPQGGAFAIPTMNWQMGPLRPAEIEAYVKRFIAYAKTFPTRLFLVTAIGTGICGHREEIIKPMFKDAPLNCVLPNGWR